MLQTNAYITRQKKCNMIFGPPWCSKNNLGAFRFWRFLIFHQWKFWKSWKKCNKVQQKCNIASSLVKSSQNEQNDHKKCNIVDEQCNIEIRSSWIDLICFKYWKVQQKCNNPEKVQQKCNKSATTFLGDLRRSNFNSWSSYLSISHPWLYPKISPDLKIPGPRNQGGFTG